MVRQLAPVDLECLSSRQGGSPYSLSQHLLNFILTTQWGYTHFRVSDILATTKTCAGGKNVGIGRGHLYLHLVLGPASRHNFYHMVHGQSEIIFFTLEGALTKCLPGQGALVPEAATPAAAAVASNAAATAANAQAVVPSIHQLMLSFNIFDMKKVVA